MTSEEKPRPMDYARAFLFHLPDKTDPVSWGLKVLLLVILLIWGLTFWFHSIASNYVAESFMHNINLPFHEAGHIIFSPFGRFLHVLGGSLGQLLIPAIVMLTFILKNRDAFAGSVGLWWIGQSFMDMAPYINDARALELPLLGGVTGQDVEDYHDWEYLLGHTGLLKADHALASISHFGGMGLMILAVVWGGYFLYRQYGTIEKKWN